MKNLGWNIFMGCLTVGVVLLIAAVWASHDYTYAKLAESGLLVTGWGIVVCITVKP